MYWDKQQRLMLGEAKALIYVATIEREDDGEQGAGDGDS